MCQRMPIAARQLAAAALPAQRRCPQHASIAVAAPPPRPHLMVATGCWKSAPRKSCHAGLSEISFFWSAATGRPAPSTSTRFSLMLSSLASTLRCV